MYDTRAVQVETLSAEMLIRTERDIGRYITAIEKLKTVALTGDGAVAALRRLSR